MNKKIRVIALNVFLVLIAITIIFSLKSSLDIDGNYAILETMTLENAQKALTNAFETTTTEKELVNAIKTINEEYASEFILLKDESVVFSTFPNVEINNIRELFNDSVVMFKSQGDILFQNQEYRLMYVLYHPDAQSFVKVEFTRIIIFIIIIFLLFLILSVVITRSLYRPLFKINDAIGEMENLDFRKAMQISGNDAVTQEFSKVAELLNNKLQDDSKKYTKLELVLLFEKQRLDFVVKMARGALHELKTPIYQLLLKTEDEKIEFTKDEQKENLSGFLQRINKLQDELKINVDMLSNPKAYFDVVLLYREIQKEFYYLLEKKDISIDFISDENAFVEMNQMGVQLILHNLLSNISKYSNEATDAVVELYTENNTLFIKTENETTEENIMRIVERNYSNAHIDDPYSSGVGTGLIEEIIEYFNGKIEFNVSENIIEINIEIPFEIENLKG